LILRTTEVENRMSRNISTVTGGITMAFEEVRGYRAEDSRVREIDVLKNVVLREEYIRRLKGTWSGCPASGLRPPPC
jgi:hypothetical protein